MIYDKLTNLRLYSFANAGLAAAAADVAFNLLGASPEGAAFRKNNIIFTTAPVSAKRYEAHKRFIDIHIVLEGREYVEVSNVDCLSNLTEYNENNDIYFGDVTTDRKFSGYLEQGCFLICFPEDTHLVGAHKHDTGVSVTKIVYKIAAAQQEE